MSTGNEEIMRALGRIEGELTGMRQTQQDQGAHLENIGGRLRTVEQRAASRGGVAGVASAVGVTLIVEGLKNWARGG